MMQMILELIIALLMMVLTPPALVPGRVMGQLWEFMALLQTKAFVLTISFIKSRTPSSFI